MLLAFVSKLRKCIEDLIKLFFWSEGKLETFAKICVAASLETLCEDPTICALQKSAAVWKLLSKISRIAPALYIYIYIPTTQDSERIVLDQKRCQYLALL